mgnify:FL=1
MINTTIRKLRTVNLNERGQIVIPEDIRKDFGIKGATTLIIIEKNDELVLKKESDILESMESDKFWKFLSRKAMKRAWSKEDKIWDKIYKENK